MKNFTINIKRPARVTDFLELNSVGAYPLEAQLYLVLDFGAETIDILPFRAGDTQSMAAFYGYELNFNLQPHTSAIDFFNTVEQDIVPIANKLLNCFETRYCANSKRDVGAFTCDIALPCERIRKFCSDAGTFDGPGIVSVEQWLYKAARASVSPDMSDNKLAELAGMAELWAIQYNAVLIGGKQRVFEYLKEVREIKKNN